MPIERKLTKGDLVTIDDTKIPYRITSIDYIANKIFTVLVWDEKLQKNKAVKPEHIKEIPSSKFTDET